MGHDDHEHKPHNPAEAFMHKQMSVESALNTLHTGSEAVASMSHGLHHTMHTPNTAAGALLAPLTIFNGGYEMASGYERIKNGESEEGTLDMIQGGAGVLEGGANLAAAMGAGSATLAPAVGAGVVGFKAGRFGDAEAAGMGWMGKDEKGKNRSISDWAADGGVDEYAKSKHLAYQGLKQFLPNRAADIGSEIYGHGQGLASSLGHSIAGVPVAIGAGVAGGAQRGWNALKGLFSSGSSDSHGEGH